MRWKPNRAGLFNIWEYDDQVFDFGDGRLVLRGRNGSGKSNALALIFPFLFDGVMSAARMDPMGGARSMKSLLLGRDDDATTTGRYRHESGTGYVWMEFVNDEDGGPGDALEDQRRGTTLTIGVGASATQQRDAQAWFFITEQRIGDELALHTNDVPLGRKQLSTALADERTDGRFGEVYTTAEEFRAGVDAALFGLGRLRYQTLVDLLLTLRRPHLAGKLDTEHLSATLSSGLAELDRALIDDVAHSFDDLDKMQEDLDGLGIALDAIERFLPTYRSHLVGVGRRRATTLVERHRDLTRVQRSITETERELQTAEERLTVHVEELDANRGERERLDVEIETIQVSPAYKSATTLGEVQRQAETARAAAAGARERAEQRSAELARAEGESATTRQRQVAAANRLTDAVDAWVTHAASIDVGTDVERDPFDVSRATALVAERTQQVDDVDAARRASATATDEAERLADESERATAALGEALAMRETAWGETRDELLVLTTARNEWAEATDDVLATLESLLATDIGRVGRVGPSIVATSEAAGLGRDTDQDAPPSHGEPDELDERVRRCADVDPQTVIAILGETELSIATAHERSSSDERAIQISIDELTGERARVADEPNPGPAPSPTRPDSASPDRPGTPLYACVDFADHVDEIDRAGIESALAAAGLLDALITPDGAVADVLDATLVPHGSGSDDGRPTLADFLVAVPTDHLSVERVATVIGSIPLDGDVVALGTDGRWRLGPVAGHYTQDQASFIGHEARERRRAEQLADLDARLEESESMIAGVRKRLDELDGLRVGVRDAGASFPSADAVVGLHRRLLEARAVVVERHERHLAVADFADSASARADLLSADLQRTANALRLPVDAHGLESVGVTLTQCSVQHREIERRQESLADCTESTEVANRREVDVAEHASTAQAEAQDADRHAATELVRYERLRADVGADAQQAVADLDAARTARRRAAATADSLNEAAAGTKATIAGMRERQTQLDSQRERLAGEADAAGARFASIRSSEVTDVLAVPGVDGDADPLPAARTLLGSTTEPDDDATNRMEREFRNVLLDGVRSGHEPSMPKVDGFDVVRVGTADGDVAIATLAADLRADRDRLDQLLSDREREIFETHLLTRVGESLRKLLLDADDFESTINVEMSKAPTSSGMTVELKWAISDEDRSIRKAVETLRFSPENMAPEQREALRDFFTHRIAELRATDPGLSFAEILTTALDYRRWHRFDLYVRSVEGGRSRVTRAYFRGLSGGEAATVLHLPLFAAASAHYASGALAGPRIIALDEAFAGIDDQMRGRLMGLLVQLDLDVILTSHEFWGFYGQVPGLVLYDLNRKPPVPGVFAQRFEWQADHAG